MNNTPHIFIALLIIFLISPLWAAREAPDLQGLQPVSISECERSDDFEPVGPDETTHRTDLSTTSGARIEGQSLRWRIESPQTSSAAIRTKWSPETEPVAVALWLKNPHGHDLSLVVEAVSPDGSKALGSHTLGEERNWYQLAFKGTAGIDWTRLTGLQMRLEGLEQQTDYAVYIDRIEAYFPPPLSADATIEGVPESAQAGDTLKIQAAVTPAAHAPAWPTISVIVEQGDFRIATRALSFPETPAAGRTQSAKPVTVRLPSYLADGTYTVKLGGPDVEFSEADWPAVSVTNRAPEPAASIDGGKRAARILFEGAPVSPVMVRADDPGAVQDVSGGTVIVVNVTSSFDLYGRSADVWLGPGEYDYSHLDARLGRIAAANPRAALLLRVSIHSPPWWDQANPDALVTFSNGSTTAPENLPGRKQAYASWASQKWREAAEESLTRLVEHLQASPISRLILGYELCGGEWGAWQYPGASRGLFAGYSQSQTEAYRRWLADQYGSLSKLRGAWGQPVQPLTDESAIDEGRPILSWQQITVPDPKQRTKSFPGMGVLREPAGSQHVVDCDLFASELMARCITGLASTVKKAAPNRLCGAPYGHLFDQARYPYLLQNGGHLAIDTVLESGYVDFLTAPPASVNDGGAATFSTISASLAAHAKATVLIPPDVADSDRLEASTEARIAMAAATGHYTALAAQTFADIKQPWREALTATAGLIRPSSAEIAVVVDDTSCAYTVPGNSLMGPLLDRQRSGLTYIGAPVDVLLLSDVVQKRAPEYRMYIFLNAFQLTDADRASLKSLLQQQNATAVYVYAAGAIEGMISGKKMSELTGLFTTRIGDSGPLQVVLPDTTYGTEASIEPRFVGVDRLIAADENAEVLASLRGTGYCGLGSRTIGGRRVIWSAAPDMPAELLRGFARQAGVHLFTERDAAVYASGDCMAVYAPRAGAYRVHLPDGARAVDLPTGNSLDDQSGELLLNLEKGQTVLMRLHYEKEGQP